MGSRWDPIASPPILFPPLLRLPRHPVHQVWLPSEKRQPDGASKLLRQWQEAEADPAAV